MGLRYSFKRAVCIAAAILLFSSLGIAQYKNGIKQLEDKDFTTAATTFRNLTTDSPTLSNLGMARYFSSAGNPAYQLDSAYVRALNAETQYRALDTKAKGKLEKELADDSPAKTRRSIEKLCYEAALKTNTVAAYDHYLTLIEKPNATNLKTIETNRNNLVYEETLKTGTLEAFDHLMGQYGNSIKLKSPSIFRASSFKLFDLYTRANGWSANASFNQKYPLSAWVRDTIVTALENTRKASLAGMEVFIKKFPGTVYGELALDTFATKVAKSAPWRYCANCLKNWPAIPHQDSIWMRLYRGYRAENPSPKQLQAFKTLFPAFPFPDLLQKEETNALDFYFQAVMRSDSMARIKRFLNEYPAHPSVDTVWQKFATRTQANAKRPIDLDAITKDPKTPVALRDKYLEIQRKWVVQVETQEITRIYASNRPQAYVGYIHRVPPSANRQAVKDSLVSFLLQSDSLFAINNFLKLYPTDPSRGALIKHLYGKERTAESAEKIADFGKRYPDFDSLRIKKDLQSLIDSKILKETYRISEWLKYHQYILAWAPSEKAFLALNKIMASDFERQNWSAVKDTLEVYKKYFNSPESQFAEMYEMFQTKGKLDKLRKVVFPEETDYSEYSPSLSADGQQLFFCRNMGSFASQEDVFVAPKKGNDWGIPVSITDLSTPFINEAPESVNSNATEMLMFKNGKLCESKKTATGWSEPLELPKEINFSFWQADARYIANGMIYVAAQGGNRDIFVAFQDAKGKWQEPRNLGPIINTISDERTPFLHSDNKTLYFSSSGHNGFGSLDLYYSTRLDDTWTNWSTPQNMGLLFNSSGDDWEFKVSLDGKTAYMVVGENGKNKIFFTNLPKVFQPEQVYVYETNVVDKEGKPISGVVEVRDKATSKLMMKVRPDPVTGKVFIPIPQDKVQLMVIPDNAPPMVLTPELRKVETDLKIPATAPIVTTDIKKDTEVPTKDILFGIGSDQILPESFAYLEEWANFIKNNGKSIEIQGHTDNTSSAEYNQVLSENRAKSVRQFLLDKNCAADKISTKGYGESKPAASNATEEGRSKNRRVVFRFLN
jgi:outer membrane protein OmpA-like peptidoglycan-associated protein